MSIATPTRLGHVQALRGFAALLVLFSHLSQIEAKTVAQPWLPPSSEWGNMGVDLFFVISGFIMVYVTRDWRDRRVRRIPEFLFARISRIYPLYWIVSLALLLVWFIRPDLVFSNSPNEPQILNSLLLIPANAYPLLEVGWTLVYEMMFYIIFAALLILPRDRLIWGLAFWAGLVGLGFGLGWQGQNALAFHIFSPLVFEFIAGAILALFYLSVPGSRLLARSLSAIGLAGLLIWFVIGGPFEDQGARVVRLLLPASLLVLGAAWLDRHGASPAKAFIRLGDWSYSLYLTHVLSLSLVSLIWRLVGLSDASTFIFLAVSILVAIMIAGLTFRLIEAPLIHRAKDIRRRFFSV